MVAAAAAGALVVAAACSGDDGGSGSELTALRESTEEADWVIRPGVEVLTISGAEPGQPLTLYDDAGDELATVEANDGGLVHFAYIPEDPEMAPDEAVTVGEGHTLHPGRYVVRDDSADPVLASPVIKILDRTDVPEAAFYESQELNGVDLGLLGEPVDGADLEDGFHYLLMRDGVQLSAMVRFPDRGIYGDGPWPTVIEYSGYGPSNPDAEEPGSRLARSFGYATVSVNMRGTGCSGGVFDTFNPAQQADGYDIVEIVARQPWVAGGRVGMIGLSYSGITQLYTAAMRPPSLAAVTAQSVIADPWLQQWPAGIYNSGFTRQWLAERERQSGAGGSEWVSDRVDGGDDMCAANVAEHALNIDFEAFGRALEMRPPDAEERDLRELVREIDTAVYVTGAFQDEQTGPQFGVLLDQFDQAQTLRASLWNGRHPDGYSTMNLVQLFEFLELYVAERVPQVPDVLRAAVPGIVAGEFGFADGVLPPDRFAEEYGDDYEAALEAYEAEDPIRLVFGSGVGANEVGEPGGYHEVTFPSWPPPTAEAQTLYLQGGGGLSTESEGAGTAAGVDTFGFDAEAGETTLVAEYDTLSALQLWNWTRFPDGRALAYETAPLPEDLVVAGSGYLDLWVGANATDADVQVTVSEVRPDGVEYLVQNGWLRLGHRAVDDERSDEFEVTHLFTEGAYEPLPADELVEARIEIPAMGQVFREGSRLRITVSSPGRNHVTWTFEPPEGVDAATTYRVGRGEDTPSALVLPVMDLEVPAPPGPVPCPGLRGQACRTAEPITNRSE